MLAIAPSAGLAAQQAPDWLTDRLDAWYRTTSRSAPGVWGIAIADQEGKILWSVQPDAPLIPASTVKLLTTGYARSVLGGEARRATRVVGHGELHPATGAWVGDWALQLNGDISLERSRGDGPSLRDLAEQLRIRGVRRLHGPLRLVSERGPATAVYPDAWSPKHRGRLFAPLIGPLMLNENVVAVTIAPGPRSGRPARLVGASPRGLDQLVTVKARTVAGRRARLALRPRGDGGWVVTGTIGSRARARGLSAVMTRPEKVVEAAWDAALRDAGITWDRQAPFGVAADSARVVLAQVMSPPLDSIAIEVNRRSLNPGAELLLHWAGGADEGPARLTQHVRTITGRTADVHLVDGSGLSYDDRVSPAAFIAYLAKFPQTTAGRNFPQLLPANGSGTLRRLGVSGFPGAGVVRAKTGTLAQVATVVGYLGRPEGTLLVSLMYNGPRPYSARQQQWRLFRLLGADGVVIPADSTAAPEDEAQYGGVETPADSSAARPVDDTAE